MRTYTLQSFSESDETTTNKVQALKEIRRLYLLYKKGEETYNMVASAEITALKLGCTPRQIEQCFDLSLQSP